MAAYDTIRLSLSQGYLDWFLVGRSLPLTFVDNQSAIALSKSSLITKRSKHISLRYHVVRDYCKDLCYCPTDSNRADPLTKRVPEVKYLQLFSPQVAGCDGVEEYDSDGEELHEDAALCVAKPYFSVL